MTSESNAFLYTQYSEVRTGEPQEEDVYAVSMRADSC
jgi:hypothetical protein